MRPNWVEISRAALLHNLNVVRAALPPETAVCAVVKANAYGHGAEGCAAVFQAAGVPWLAVTSAEEGLALRRMGINTRVLVLGGFSADDAPLLVSSSLTPAVWDAQQLAWLAAALRHHGQHGFAIHVKFDSGMARLGVTPEQEPAFFRALAQTPELAVEAVLTHFSSAEDEDSDITVHQMERFHAARARCAAALAPPAMWHASNSAAALRFPQWGGSFVRSGLALYGYALNQSGPIPELRPALAWKTRIIALRNVAVGQPVGYSGAFVTTRTTRVATLAVGYGDGYSRRLSSVGAGATHVIVRGRCAPVIGNVSMDLTTVDVTGIAGAAIGDEVILIGRHGQLSVTAADLARTAGTIPYEILCAINQRVDRKFID